MAEDRGKALVKRWRALKETRAPHMAYCDDLARVMLPQRIGFASQVEPGQRRTDEIFDGTGMQAARGLANATGGMLRPDGQQWIFIEAADDESKTDDEAKDWLADSEDRLVSALDAPRARFRQALGEADLDLVVFGMASVFTNEADCMDNLLFQTLHPKDAVPFFGEEGSPEGMFRSRSLKVRQARDKFGADNLSDAVKKLIEQDKLDDNVEFLHAVLPRREAQKGASGARNMPFASLWMETESGKIVRESGFREFPYAVPRWDTSSGDDTGMSPGMIALPDTNTLQAMEETVLIAGQRAAAPPLLAPNDGTFDAANTFPDGITYYDADLAKTLGRIPVGPMDTGGNLPIVVQMQDNKRQQVFAAYLRNVLNLPVDGPQMTATEVMQRKEEFIREIGPVFGRLETDYTAPIVERAFLIMFRAGGFLPVPDSLAGRKIRFRYQSPVKKIRQQVEAAAARMWALELVELEQVRPGALDVLDIDEYARFQAEAGNVPQRIIVSKDRVAEIRMQRLEQQQQAAEAAMMEGVVDSGTKVMKALPKQGQAA